MPDASEKDHLDQVCGMVRALSLYQNVTHSARVFGESGGVEDGSYPRGDVPSGEMVLVQFQADVELEHTACVVVLISEERKAEDRFAVVERFAQTVHAAVADERGNGRMSQNCLLWSERLDAHRVRERREDCLLIFPKGHEHPGTRFESSLNQGSGLPRFQCGQGAAGNVDRLSCLALQPVFQIIRQRIQPGKNQRSDHLNQGRQRTGMFNAEGGADQDQVFVLQVPPVGVRRAGRPGPVEPGDARGQVPKRPQGMQDVHHTVPERKGGGERCPVSREFCRNGGVRPEKLGENDVGNLILIRQVHGGECTTVQDDQIRPVVTNHGGERLVHGHIHIGGEGPHEAFAPEKVGVRAKRFPTACHSAERGTCR